MTRRQLLQQLMKRQTLTLTGMWTSNPMKLLTNKLRVLTHQAQMYRARTYKGQTLTGTLTWQRQLSNNTHQGLSLTALAQKAEKECLGLAVQRPSSGGLQVLCS